MTPPICLISSKILARNRSDDRFKFYGRTKILLPTPPTFLGIMKYEPSAGGAQHAEVLRNARGLADRISAGQRRDREMAPRPQKPACSSASAQALRLRVG